LRAQNAPAEKSDPIDGLIKAADKLGPLIEKFMPKVVDAGKEIVRGRRPGFGELLMEQGLPILGDILKPWSNVLAAKFMQGPPSNSYAAPPIAAPAAPPAPGQPAIAAATPPAQPPRLIQFLSQPLVMGAFQAHFQAFMKDEKSEAGFDFAYWIFTSGAGEQPLIDARAMGTTQILALFKSAPQWPVMQPHEAKLTAFLNQVLSWSPKQDQPDEEEEDEVTDLTAAETM
jgi:hypothetical protein